MFKRVRRRRIVIAKRVDTYLSLLVEMRDNVAAANSVLANNDKAYCRHALFIDLPRADDAYAVGTRFVTREVTQ